MKRSIILKEDIEKQVDEIGEQGEEFDKIIKEKDWANIINALAFEMSDSITARRDGKTRESIKIEKLEKGKYYTKEVLKYCGWTIKELYQKKLIRIIQKEKPEGVIELKDILKEKESKIQEEESLYSQVCMFLIKREKDNATELLTKTFLKENHIYTIRHDEKAEMWIYKEGIYIPQGKSYIEEFCRKVLGKVYTNQFTNNVIAKISADTFIDSTVFFDNNIVKEIPVLNGVLNIITRELTPFTPKKIFFNKLPVNYNTKKECPRIKEHLKTVLENEEDLLVMQELFGSLLLKEYKIEKSSMWKGKGRNGKGKTLDLMKRFLGHENCVSITIQELEKNDFMLCNLFGKMANLAGDLSPTALANTGRFKNLTGRDLITANRKFLPPIVFTNYAKMIFACNELPKTYDLTIAFWERWVYLNFPYQFITKKDMDKLPEKERVNKKIIDPDIMEKLTSQDELDGLLNWALDGLDRLLEQKNFSSSNTAKDIESIWMRTSNSFYAFLKDQVIKEYDSRISKVEMRKSYSEYCGNFDLKPEGDKVLKHTLMTLFGSSEDRKVDENGKQQACWEGIKFSKGSKDSNGFSTLIGNAISPKSVNTLTNLTNLTNPLIEEEIISEDPKKENVISDLIHHKCSICNETPCVAYHRDKPICKGCNQQIKAKG